MPEKLKREIMDSLRKAHPSWSAERVKDTAYATMVKQGSWKPTGKKKAK